MTTKEIFFCCILLGNAVVAVLYLLFGILYVRRCEAKEEEEREGYGQITGEEEGETGKKAKKKKAGKKEKKAEKTEKKEKTGKNTEKIEKDKESRKEKEENEKKEKEKKKEENEKKEKENEKKKEENEKKEKGNGKKETDTGEEEPEEELPMRDGRKVYVMRFIIMLLCPVVGPIFFGVGHFMFLFVFRQDVHLEDVVFSKERVRTNERADEERERNIAPLEEALAVSDKESLRSLMLNVIRGDIHNSLAAISLALNSQDSETSHYAASVLQDELNDFRGNVQKVWREIEKEEDDETDCEYYLIPYMNNMLEQKVFTDMEQKNMVKKFVDVGESLYRKASHRITSQYYEWICLRLLDVRDFETMETWCIRAAQQYPEELSSYTCKLKLYFTAEEKDKFFETLDALKHSSIVIDKETLALIRTFG